MNFLPPIPIPADIIRGYAGYGGIAVNADGTLVASVDRDAHCVYIYDATDRTADAIIVGTAGTAGSAHGEFNHPASACFVHREGVDTLLICDFRNDRVVEVSERGEFMRAIALPVDSRPWGVAERDGVIAMSLWAAHAVVLLQYESCEAKTIGTGTYGNADGQLHFPRGVTFTTDGCNILVADNGNNRVSTFSAASGAFIAHVISNGILYPRDVLQCEDGSMVVAHRDGVTCVGKDGVVTVQSIDVRAPGSGPSALSYSPSLNGVVVKCFGGNMFFLRDAWSRSLRCAWVHACVRV
jgi:DNA-binding beta-propeller fold protein YncE